MAKIKLEIKWAFIFIVVMLAWMVLEKLVGLHDKHIDLHSYTTNLFAIPAIIIYVLALRDKKRKDYKGQMSYTQGFISGLIITLIILILSPFIQWFIISIITPEYFQNAINYSVESGYYTSIEQAEAYFNLNSFMIQSVIGAFAMGVVTSGIVSFFVRTKYRKDR